MARQPGFQQGLRLLEAVQGHAHVYMVRRVFHDVVHKCSHACAKCQVHGGRHKGAAADQSALLSYQATLVWVW